MSGLTGVLFRFILYMCLLHLFITCLLQRRFLNEWLYVFKPQCVGFYDVILLATQLPSTVMYQ